MLCKLQGPCEAFGCTWPDCSKDMEEAMPKDLTDDERIELRRIVTEMRAIASAAGSLHSFWDCIGDMEAFLSGTRCILQHNAKEWIAYGDEQLEKSKARKRPIMTVFKDKE